MKTRKLWLFPVFFLLLTGVSQAASIALAVDQRDWIPFAYKEKDAVVGMHIDVVKQALTSLGYTLEITALPRRRALFAVEQGQVDGMISVSYYQELDKSMTFPRDAATSLESDWRIMQIDHVLVTASKDYRFTGDLKTIPQPVRIPAGESLVADLKRLGLNVEEANTDLQNFQKMLRDREGSLITTTIIAEKMNENPAFRNQFKIHATPLTSLSYFVTFSKKTTLTSAEQQKIWDEIRKWRDDYLFMLTVFAHY